MYYLQDQSSKRVCKTIFVLLYNTFWKNICIPVKPEGNYNVTDVLFSNEEIFSSAENLLNYVLTFRIFHNLCYNGNLNSMVFCRARFTACFVRKIRAKPQL